LRQYKWCKKFPCSTGDPKKKKLVLLIMSKGILGKPEVQKRLKDFLKILMIKNDESWALVAHTYNSSYSGGRDQED
jgi:hypothetical protein